MKRLSIIAAALALVAVACGDDDSTATTAAPSTEAPTATEAPATTQAPTTSAAPTTAAPTTSAGSGATFEINEDGEVFIDWAALEGVFFAAPSAGSSDPFYHVHNDPGTDGFFLSVEAYTTGYGTAWTGELGMFQIDCTPAGSGICVHFDPDGAGPIGNLGADFMTSGDIEVLQADGDGFVGVLTNVEFSDGTTIPGPVTVTGGVTE